MDDKKIKNKHSIISILKPYMWLILFLIILTVAWNWLNLVIPKIISNAIDTYSSGSFLLTCVMIEFF